MKTFLFVGLGLLIGVLIPESTHAQQIFDLVEPTGEVTATAEIQGGQMLVRSRTGQQASFSRDPSLDSEALASNTQSNPSSCRKFIPSTVILVPPVCGPIEGRIDVT